MGRHKQSWEAGSSQILAAIMVIAALCTPGCVREDSEDPGVMNDAGSPDTSIESVDGGLPVCQDGKVDNGIPCRPSETDGGVLDATNPTDMGTEASPDAEVPPADSGTPTDPCEPFYGFAGEWVCQDLNAGWTGKAMVRVGPAIGGMCVINTQLLDAEVMGNPNDPYGVMNGPEGSSDQFTPDGKLLIKYPPYDMNFTCIPSS